MASKPPRWGVTATKCPWCRPILERQGVTGGANHREGRRNRRDPLVSRPPPRRPDRHQGHEQKPGGGHFPDVPTSRPTRAFQRVHPYFRGFGGTGTATLALAQASPDVPIDTRDASKSRVGGISQTSRRHDRRVHFSGFTPFSEVSEGPGPVGDRSQVSCRRVS